MNTFVETVAPPQELLDQIVPDRNGFFEPELEGLSFAPALGFLVVKSALHYPNPNLRIVGFHADAEDRAEIVPAITLEERPEDRRGLRDNAKGMGIIIGNTPSSIYRPTEEGRDRSVGVWVTPALAENQITDLHHPDPEALAVKISGVIRMVHAHLIAKSFGTDTAVRHLERRYGAASLAVIDPAPTFLLAQRREGVVHPIPPVWGVYRDPTRQPLRHIGRVE